MAFECKQTTEVGSEETSTDCLIHPYSRKFNLDQTISINSREILSTKPKILANEALLSYTESITDLPWALISEILNFLEPKDIGIVTCVNTILYRIASEHRSWKRFNCERWGPPSISPENLELGHNEMPWKELFLERVLCIKASMGRYSVDTLYGHTDAVRTVFVLACKKMLFTSGYDQIVRMCDLEVGGLIPSSQPLGCTIRAVTADMKLLVAGGTDGFIHGWSAEEGNPHLFDLRSSQENKKMEFRIWGHEGPITCLALDFSKIYSGLGTRLYMFGMDLL